MATRQTADPSQHKRCRCWGKITSDAAFHSQLKRLLWIMAHVNISRYTNDTTWSSGQDGRMSRCHTRVTRSVREEGSKGSEQVLEVVLGGEVNIIHIYMNNCSCMQYLYFKARSLALFGGVRLNLDSGFRAIPGVGACLSQWDSSNDVTLPTAGRALRAVFSSWNALNCMWIPPPPLGHAKI